ncbi:MAG: hypothetical protein QF546_14100 [Alphaproteobacteria bacterium]|nr:hypothetical protein [Alphaproteobacteria bacterium]
MFLRQAAARRRRCPTPHFSASNKHLNLVKIAKNVGPTSRTTCGTCHFKGGGGKAVNRLVCNACHRQGGGKVVSPMARKKAEWQRYFEAGEHGTSGNTDGSVHYYTSRAYRSAIKAENKAAAKFLKFPDAAMSAHVVEFYIHGAKDSDTPARCQ